MGRVDINILTENPFLEAKKIIEKIQNEADMIFIDFHAEATAEKIALGYYLDGKVTAIFGTHTHVQTADERSGRRFEYLSANRFGQVYPDVRCIYERQIPVYGKYRPGKF
jgi:calcineurin-like phosphoesterase